MLALRVGVAKLPGMHEMRHFALLAPRISPARPGCDDKAGPRRGRTGPRAVFWRLAVSAALVLLAGPALAQGETIDQALCRMIEGAASSHGIPAEFLTRLIWQESSFRLGVTSGAGAQGVAQFMPGTAAERQLADPFDPEQAIPKSAELLEELRRRFGNLGLAAAAYNGGPARVEAWLAGKGSLPGETRNYVSIITGRTAEEWAAAARGEAREQGEEERPTKCLVLVAGFRRGTDRRIVEVYAGPLAESPLAAWGVQIAGNFSKDRALATYQRARQRFAAILGEAAPMVIGTRLRSRGTRAFYRVRVPAATRQAATELCGRLHKAGGACVALKS
jgi:hypothetical protein